MEPIATYAAKGGDPKNIKPVADGDGKHYAGLTTAGKFKLHHSGKHVSNTWSFSKIKWGVPIKESASDRDVLFEDPPGRWHSVRKRLMGDGPSAQKTDIIAGLLQLYEHIAPNCSAKLPNTWVFNDFGHITWYMVRADHTHQLPGSQPKIHNEFIHTTQRNEYQTSHHRRVILEYSHGCIHVKPRDIDEMARKGYLKAGNWFIVHRYNERPRIVINRAVADNYHRFQLHFFPGLEAVIVYGY
jgi:hypothetical protein